MLTIYTDKESIPKDMKYIHDADACFMSIHYRQSYFVDRVLEDVEEGKYLNENGFISRDGFNVSIFDLSTTSKALISLEQINDCLNFSEVCFNGYHLLEELSRDVNIYAVKKQAEGISDIIYGSNISYRVLEKGEVIYEYKV